MNTSSKRVVIDIKTDGHVTIDAQGFVGGSCAMATRELELVLSGGGSGVDDKRKPEFAMNPGATNMRTN